MASLKLLTAFAAMVLVASADPTLRYDENSFVDPNCDSSDSIVDDGNSNGEYDIANGSGGSNDATGNNLGYKGDFGTGRTFGNVESQRSERYGGGYGFGSANIQSGGKSSSDGEKSNDVGGSGGERGDGTNGLIISWNSKNADSGNNGFGIERTNIGADGGGSGSNVNTYDGESSGGEGRYGYGRDFIADWNSRFVNGQENGNNFGNRDISKIEFGDNNDGGKKIIDGKNIVSDVNKKNFEGIGGNGGNRYDASVYYENNSKMQRVKNIYNRRFGFLTGSDGSNNEYPTDNSNINVNDRTNILRVNDKSGNKDDSERTDESDNSAYGDTSEKSGDVFDNSYDVGKGRDIRGDNEGEDKTNYFYENKDESESTDVENTTFKKMYTATSSDQNNYGRKLSDAKRNDKNSYDNDDSEVESSNQNNYGRKLSDANRTDKNSYDNDDSEVESSNQNNYGRKLSDANRTDKNSYGNDDSEVQNSSKKSSFIGTPIKYKYDKAASSRNSDSDSIEYIIKKTKISQFEDDSTAENNSNKNPLEEPKNDNVVDNNTKNSGASTKGKANRKKGGQNKRGGAPYLNDAYFNQNNQRTVNFETTVAKSSKENNANRFKIDKRRGWNGHRRNGGIDGESTGRNTKPRSSQQSVEQNSDFKVKGEETTRGRQKRIENNSLYRQNSYNRLSDNSTNVNINTKDDDDSNDGRLPEQDERASNVNRKKNHRPINSGTRVIGTESRKQNANIFQRTQQIRRVRGNKKYSTRGKNNGRGSVGNRMQVGRSTRGFNGAVPVNGKGKDRKTLSRKVSKSNPSNRGYRKDSSAGSTSGVSFGFEYGKRPNVVKNPRSSSKSVFRGAVPVNGKGKDRKTLSRRESKSNPSNRGYSKDSSAGSTSGASFGFENGKRPNVVNNPRSSSRSGPRGTVPANGTGRDIKTLPRKVSKSNQSNRGFSGVSFVTRNGRSGSDKRVPKIDRNTRPSAKSGSYIKIPSRNLKGGNNGYISQAKSGGGNVENGKGLSGGSFSGAYSVSENGADGNSFSSSGSSSGANSGGNTLSSSGSSSGGYLVSGNGADGNSFSSSGSSSGANSGGNTLSSSGSSSGGNLVSGNGVDGNTFTRSGSFGGANSNGNTLSSGGSSIGTYSAGENGGFSFSGAYSDENKLSSGSI